MPRRLTPSLPLPPSPAGEARTDAYVQAHGGEDAVFDQFVEPASLILSTLLKSCLPKTASRQEILRRSASLKLPNNPLDDLMERMGGPSAVAEMTGRAKRFVKMRDGTYK